MAFRSVWNTPISNGMPTKIQAAATFQAGVRTIVSVIACPPSFRRGSQLGAAGCFGFEMVAFVDGLDQQVADEAKS